MPHSPISPPGGRRLIFLSAGTLRRDRSIEQLEPVSRARVQVAIPERSSVLAARERAPSASVVVKLVPGRELDNAQAKAIVHLVASSVESLDPANVTVVDGSG